MPTEQLIDKYLKFEWETVEPHERVAVIGCGPAGLLAAWGAARCGYKVEIFTDRKSPSTQVGAQYIHHLIPGVTTEDEAQWVTYSHVGTVQGYSKKIYGPDFPPEETSWSKFEGVVPAWPMGLIYRRLWNFFEDAIIEARIDVARLEKIAQHNHTVFSTMPLDKLLTVSEERRDEFYKTEKIFGYPRMMTPGYRQPHGPNTIVYNGWASVRWYRQSSIFGQEWTEWPYNVEAEGVKEDVERYGHEYNPMLLWQAVKPVACTLPIHLLIPPNVRLVGRYGRWQKGVLSHEAYEDVVNHLEGASSTRSLPTSDMKGGFSTETTEVSFFD